MHSLLESDSKGSCRRIRSTFGGVIATAALHQITVANQQARQMRAIGDAT
jgi:hypothetical protein